MKKPITRKTKNITPVTKQNVTPAFNPIVPTTRYSDMLTTPIYHAKTVVDISRVTCQVNHLTHKANGELVAHVENNVCKSHKKFSICLHVFSSAAQEHMKHCGLQKCPSCSKEVNILQHKCYPQPVKHEKKKRKINEEEEQQSHTVFIYFDIEAQKDTGNHVANLVCAETDRNNVQFTFEGKDCIQ